ncbi:DUF1641 domain-containing protein [Neobacillus sp. SM06]|uniref:DUF1641 domain-containing protein n=1 Tax=Neobacillus sp. SM06 TaxID=3422492 RepID=UPI003D2D6698
MAKATTFIRKLNENKAEENNQAIAEMMEELANNRQAIMEGIHILKGLHDIGALQALQALLEQRTAIGEIAIQQVNQPKMHNVIKNAMTAFGFLSSLDPQKMNTLLDGVSQGFDRIPETNEKQSLWALQKRFWTQEIRASLTVVVNFLDGMGEAFLRREKER